MVTVHLVNNELPETDKNYSFKKEFESPFLARTFINKCIKGSKLKVVMIDADTYEEYNAARSALYEFHF